MGVWPSKVHYILLGVVALKASLCVHKLITQSPLSTLSSLIVLHICLVVHVITGMHSMHVFLHGVFANRIPTPQLTVLEWKHG